MSYNDEDEIDVGFKVGGSDEDEPLDMPDVPEELDDSGLDGEDPDKDR